MEYNTVQSINVPFAYPIDFTRNICDLENPVLRSVLTRSQEKGRQVLAFVDAGLAAAHPNLCSGLSTYIANLSEWVTMPTAPIIVPGGETIKNGWKYTHQIIASIEEHHLCRHSYVLAIGGGALLDAVGFAAGIVHRGIRLVRLPSTTLSQDDSGIGVKTGINLGETKNMLGTFTPPYAVINDYNFLTTLDHSLILDGMAEAFKVAIIKDNDFFTFLHTNAAAIGADSMPVIEEAVYRSARIHMNHIATSDDPFEFGVARPLDFGHWAAHMLESMSGYKLRHGAAVAVGIGLDTCYAALKGMITLQERDTILEAMRGCGMQLYHPLLNERDNNDDYCILKGLELFREHLGGHLSITLPTGIGACCEVTSIDPELVKQSIQELCNQEQSQC